MHTFQIKGDSLLHRLNPLSKVIALLPVMLLIALTTDPWTPLAFILLTLLLVVVGGRIPFGRVVRIAAPVAVLMVGFVFFYPLVIRRELVADSPLLWQWGPLTVHEAGVQFGVTTALRVYALVLFSLPFSLTTDASDFVRALVQQWRLPYKLGYGALAALRFVPMLQHEFMTIRAAHRVRGLSTEGGLRTYLWQARHYAIPLLVSAIRQAERTALAMDSRAFGAFPTRTYARRMHFAARDYLFIGAFWLLCLLILAALWQLGLLGRLVWLQIM